MIKFKSVTATFSLAVIASSTVLAQEQENFLQEIVVIANRIPVPVKQIGTSVSIIDKEDIQAHGNFSLTDVLRQSAAIGVTNNGGAGSLSSVRIRGEEGFRTLTLFDGLRLSDPSGPQVATSLEHIPSSGVGRVEILRGPQGLSYGADAGGIISISSAASEPGLRTNIDVQGGSRGSRQLSADLSAASEVLDFYLSASEFETGGYNVRVSDSILADKDGYQNNAYHTRLGFNASENLRLELVHRNVEGETQYDACYSGYSQAYDCQSIYDQQASRLSLNYGSESFSHSVSYANTRTDRDDLALGVSAFSSNGELSRWEYVGSASNLPGFDLVFGIDLEQEKNGSEERDNAGYYLEYLSDFSDSFFLTAGMRQDDNGDYGKHTSSRLSAAYLFDFRNSTVKLKTSYGSGFRAPSLFEVAYNGGPYAFPPAAGTVLGEESSAGFEYGIEYFAADNLRLELVVFDQDVEDAIIFDLAGYSGYLQDTGSSTSEGMELIGEFALSAQWRLTANLTFNDTERPNGLQRLRRPEQLANLGVNYRSSNQRLSVNAFYRTSRDAIDEQFGTPVSLDDFEVLDITARYKLSEQFDIYARFENALNASYQEVADFVSPDRASYVGIRLNF
ncbi:MAG: TonB-dependent receptor [Pseudohongiella sp.]|jgi:vitamin B12 transporter|nr:TonB-dependent receptor [Pseudohongiella sp.]